MSLVVGTPFSPFSSPFLSLSFSPPLFSPFLSPLFFSPSLPSLFSSPLPSLPFSSRILLFEPGGGYTFLVFCGVVCFGGVVLGWLCCVLGWVVWGRLRWGRWLWVLWLVEVVGAASCGWSGGGCVPGSWGWSVVAFCPSPRRHGVPLRPRPPRGSSSFLPPQPLSPSLPFLPEVREFCLK